MSALETVLVIIGCLVLIPWLLALALFVLGGFGIAVATFLEWWRKDSTLLGKIGAVAVFLSSLAVSALWWWP